MNFFRFKEEGKLATKQKNDLHNIDPSMLYQTNSNNNNRPPIGTIVTKGNLRKPSGEFTGMNAGKPIKFPKRPIVRETPRVGGKEMSIKV